MEMQQHYVVLLRKGPTWAPGDTPELDALQERHLAHIRSMHESGSLIVAGPTEAYFGSDLRGVWIFRADAFESVEDLMALAERAPSIQAGRLRAECASWYHPPF